MQSSCENNHLLIESKVLPFNYIYIYECVADDDIWVIREISCWIIRTMDAWTEMVLWIIMRLWRPQCHCSRHAWPPVEKEIVIILIVCLCEDSHAWWFIQFNLHHVFGWVWSGIVSFQPKDKNDHKLMAWVMVMLLASCLLIPLLPHRAGAWWHPIYRYVYI